MASCVAVLFGDKIRSQSKPFLYLFQLVAAKDPVHDEEVTVDAPINSEDEKYIKRVLKARISASDVFIVVAGMYTAHSDWMKWEIETAVANNIPVIGIKPHGSQRTPQVVTDNAKIIVGWYTPSIISAIKDC
ncbi:TIR domain-containing protein [Aeromonas caviae]|uniref:TIR domain-containing protein n=1 Tax=Aeromonas caviae TaxID=648 RepID=UPI0022816364|nr:TIR domain-containing protein [Aeromonas caviae]MCY9810960.1 TIR domain-containing protein [Aeromonas caviae]